MEMVIKWLVHHIAHGLNRGLYGETPLNKWIYPFIAEGIISRIFQIEFLRPLIRHRNALQLNCNGGREGRNFHGGAAGLIVFEIFGIHPIVDGKIGLHIGQKYGYVYQFIP
jgi:hypothetical protein